ncbi:MAG: hypothetical protein ACI857_000082 [Arenicella sp.]|jgi:hypothetical protein
MMDPGVTQMKDTRSPVKALYIYNFATLIDWPSDYRKGDFVIGVYGSKEGVYDNLKTKFEGKAIGSQEIVIENYSSLSQIDKAHILYVSPRNSSQIGSLDTKFKGKSTLLVTEKTGYLSKGAAINFVVKGASQKFEINKGNAKKHKLIIADRLLKLASSVVE